MRLTLEKQWETFHDSSYYDMFAVRMKSDRCFNSQTLFHVPSKAEADALCDILNGFQGQLDAEKAELARLEADNKRLREEVDGLRGAISNGYAEGDLDFLMYLVKKVNEAALAQTNLIADAGKMVSPDAVEALKYALLAADIRRENSTSAVSLEEARDVAFTELNKMGYTLRRETMTEAELEQEAERLASTDWYLAVEIAELAKKYRG